MNDKIMSSLSKIYEVVSQRTILMKENMILQQTGVDTWIHNLEYVAPITSCLIINSQAKFWCSNKCMSGFYNWIYWRYVNELQHEVI